MHVESDRLLVGKPMNHHKASRLGREERRRWAYPVDSGSSIYSGYAGLMG